MQRRALVVMTMVGLFGAAALAASLQLKDLPAAVKKTVQDNLKGGQITSIAKEKEEGIDQYEIETVVNGKARDFNVDTKGTLLVVEEEITIDALPEAARAAIMKRVGGGTLGVIESVQSNGKRVTYEAAFSDKGGKKHSVVVNADGTDAK